MRAVLWVAIVVSVVSCAAAWKNYSGERVLRIVPTDEQQLERVRRLSLTVSSRTQPNAPRLLGNTISALCSTMFGFSRRVLAMLPTFA